MNLYMSICYTVQVHICFVHSIYIYISLRSDEFISNLIRRDIYIYYLFIIYLFTFYDDD